MSALGVILFVIALLVSIMLHEAGHYVSARVFGGKVTEFFVGFGARIWSFRRGETEYGVKAIPAGGYVKIVGMTELEPIEPEDEPHAFYRKSAPKRLLTLSAGSIVHLIIGVVLLIFIAGVWGEPKTDNTPTIGAIATCIPTQAAQDCNPAIPAPAKAVGLQPNDKIVKVNGTPIADFDALTNAIHGLTPGKPAHLVIQRGSSDIPVTVTPVKGDISTDPSKPQPETLIGIGQRSYTQHLGAAQAFGNGFSRFGTIFTGSIKGLASIPGSIPKLFSSTVHHTQRGDNTPSGVVGMAQVGGSLFGSRDFPDFISLIAGVNIFIGIFNMLPILPLDGGHVGILLYEQARRGVYRLFGRRDPGRVDLNKMLPVAYAFLMVFAGLTVLLLAADITNPIRLGG